MKIIRIFNFLIVDFILPSQVVCRASVKTLSPFNSFLECVDLIESDPSTRNVNRKSSDRNRTNILSVTNSQTFKPGISVGWQMVRRYVKCPPAVLLLCKNALIGPKNWSHPNYRWQSHICEEHLRVINLVLCDSLMDSETGHVPPAGSST